MVESSAEPTRNAISVAAEVCRDAAEQKRRGRMLPGEFSFARLASDLWPRKTAACLHHLLGGIAERTCRAWATDANVAPANALVVLLRGDQGGRVLTHIMQGAKPRWWTEIGRWHLLASIYDAQSAGLDAPQQLELRLE
jgi:hypothetical protein